MRGVSNKLVVEPYDHVNQTESGLILVGEEHKYHKGKVLSVGQEIKDVVPGDEIIYGRAGVVDVTEEGKDLHVVGYGSVLFVV